MLEIGRRNFCFINHWMKIYVVLGLVVGLNLLWKLWDNIGITPLWINSYINLHTTYYFYIFYVEDILDPQRYFKPKSNDDALARRDVKRFQLWRKSLWIILSLVYVGTLQ